MEQGLTDLTADSRTSRTSFTDRLIEQSDPTERRSSRQPMRCKNCLICVGVLVVLTAVLIPVSLFVIGPAVAQNTINQAAVTLLNATMYSPTNDSVTMSTFLEMSAPNGNLFSAEMNTERVTVGTPGMDFGEMMMPQLSIHSSNIYLNVTSRLRVTDVEAFTSATAGVLQGHPRPWMIRGHPTVKVKMAGMTLTYHLKMEKTFDLPTTLFIQMESKDVNILETNSTTVTATASATFFSSSVLELLNMGTMVFNLTNTQGTVIGFVEVPNFRARRDFNSMDCRMTAQSLPDGSNVNAINDFFRTFASGANQIAVMRGPIRSLSPFLSNIVTQNVTIRGQRAVSNLRVDNMRISSCDDSGITSTSLASLFSDMPLNVSTLQVDGAPVVLEILSEDGVHVGTSALDHDLVQGFNEFSLTATLAASQPGDIAAVKNVLKRFSNGELQTLSIRGPYGHPNPFLNNIFESSLTLNGAKAVEGATASNFKILAANATHLETSCTIEFSSQFPIDMSTVGGSLTFELHNANGTFLGTSTVAQDIILGMNIIPNSVTYLFLEDSDSNHDALHAFLSTMSAGTDQMLTMTGPVNSASTLLDHSLGSTVRVKGAVLLSNVVTYNVSPTSGTVDTLLSTATTSFTTMTGVVKGAFGGPVVFGMRSNQGVELGSCTMDTDIVSGLNVVDHSASLVKTDASAAAIEDFNSQFLSRQDQVIEVYGPINTPTPFLNGIFSTTATLKGIAVDMVASALVDSLSLGGYSVTVDGSTKTIRGTKLVINNPFPAVVKQSNMVLDVSLHEPIAYTFSDTFFGTSGHECGSTTAFSQQITEKGMFKNNVNVDYVTLGSQTLTTFFSPSQPQPSQAAQQMCKAIGLIPILPCCFLSVVPAAACRAVNTHGELIIRLRTEGSLTVSVGDFVTNVHFVQENTPLMFDEDIIKGFIADGEMNCGSFTFH